MKRHAHFQEEEGKSAEEVKAGEKSPPTHHSLDNRSATSQTTRSSLTLDEENDDDDDDDDDEETQLRSQAFQRHQSKSLLSSQGRGSSQKLSIIATTTKSASSQLDDKAAEKQQQQQQRPGLVHRFDEYGDFLTRSERSRRAKTLTEAFLAHPHLPHDQHAPHNQQDHADSGRTSSSKVRWPAQVESSIRILPELTEWEASAQYLAKDAWERIDLDVEMTKKRFDNHAAGLIPFDLENNTIRGLECAVDDEACRKRDSAMHRHATGVLREQNRQRIKGEFYDGDKMRAVAASTSRPMQDEAHLRGQRDAEDAVGVWMGVSSEENLLPSLSAPMDKSTKSRRHGGVKNRSGSSGFNLLGLFQTKPKKK
jgi:hypothetical protein